MISKGRVMTFRSDDGRDVYGVFYAPANAECEGPKNTLPPLIVLVHGGPTSMTERGFKPRVQFFTTRGFAVLDLDYSGSTGYGRACGERLDGRWGEIDVADAALAPSSSPGGSTSMARAWPSPEAAPVDTRC